MTHTHTAAYYGENNDNNTHTHVEGVGEGKEKGEVKAASFSELFCVQLWRGVSAALLAVEEEHVPEPTKE